MQISVNVDAEEPLFAQLINQVKQGVTEGALKPGDALPSIRQLARDLEVNHKTVAKAYRLLERDCVIRTQGYRGTFIHKEAVNNSTTDLGAMSEARLEQVIVELRNAGATDSEIRIAFTQAMNKV